MENVMQTIKNFTQSLKLRTVSWWRHARYRTLTDILSNLPTFERRSLHRIILSFINDLLLVIFF